MTSTTLVQDAQPNIRSLLTVERLLYAVILLTGVGLRIYHLGAQPLTPGEASQSWPAWQAALGLPAPDAPLSPSALLTSLQLFVFWITQGGDAAARLMPALAGSLMLLTPWLLRPWLGRTTALALALLMAVDPWLVAFSRLADSAILATALMVFGLTFLARLSLPGLTNDARRSWLYGAAGAVGLLLVSGPLAWSYLPLLILFAATVTWPAQDAAGRQALREQSKVALLILVLSALLGATAWLARPVGLASVGGSLGAWLAQFTGGDYGLGWTLTRLMVDQPFNLLFGSVGLALLWRRRNDATLAPLGWPLFLTVWLLWGMLWQALPGRTPQALLVLGLPLLLAAAYALGRLVECRPRPLNGREGGLLLLGLTVLLVAGRFALNNLLDAPAFDLDLALIIVLVALGMLLLVVAFAAWTDGPTALWIGGLFVALWLLLGSVASMWQLSQLTSPQRPSGLIAEISHPGIRLLAEDLRTLSAQRAGDAQAKPVQAQMTVAPDPLLGWYLRERRIVDWVRAPDLEPTGPMPLVIALPPASLSPASTSPAATLSAAGETSMENQEQSPAPAGYIGSNYHIRYRWLPSQLWAQPVAEFIPLDDANWRQAVEGRVSGVWQARLRPALRWMSSHTVAMPPERDAVQLWVMPEE